ncbi:hypothetical protein ACSSUQ_004234 [Yersinia enterocolitica]
MKKDLFDDETKEKGISIIKSYTTFNPKKIGRNFKYTASNTINTPVKFARDSINLFKVLSGSADKNIKPLSFEELYIITKCEENTRQKNYTTHAILSLFGLFFFFLFMVLGVLKVISEHDVISKVSMAMSYGTAVLIFFSLYFRFTVRAFCLKYRTVSNKLNAFKRFEDLVPNPYHDLRSTTNSDNKNMVAILETKEEQENKE